MQLKDSFFTIISPLKPPKGFSIDHFFSKEKKIGSHSDHENKFCSSVLDGALEGN